MSQIATETCLFCGRKIPDRSNADTIREKDRIALVKECGFYCKEPIAECCKSCPAKDFCDEAIMTKEAQ